MLLRACPKRAWGEGHKGLTPERPEQGKANRIHEAPVGRAGAIGAIEALGRCAPALQVTV